MAADKEIQLGALKIFAAVAEAETLTHAAQKLGITQSAVSQAIAQLEQTTATQLVVRRSRPIKLTPSGLVLKKHASDILASTRRMVAAVQSASDTGLPRLRLGFVDSFGDAAAPRLSQRMESLAVKLSMQTGFTSPLSQAFLGRDLDILITSDPVDDHPELERHAIMRDPFVILVAQKHCGDKEPTAEELSMRLPFVRYNKRSRLGMMTNLIARRLNIEPQTRYELDSTQTLLRFVQSGQGWAFATGLCIARHRGLLEGVRVMPLANSANARYLSLMARHNELGTIPEKVAEICRDICDEEIVPELLEHVPWLAGEIRSITELPII